MKIGIISDTHGDRAAIDDALRLAPDAKFWLHAGDLVNDALYLEEKSGVGVIKVAGNCDWPGEANDVVVAEAAGTKIFLTHGHFHGVKFGTSELIAAAKAAGAAIAVYGHTHVAKIERGEILVLNPGSASRPRDERRPSFMVLELTPENAPQVKIIRRDE